MKKIISILISMILICSLLYMCIAVTISLLENNAYAASVVTDATDTVVADKNGMVDFFPTAFGVVTGKDAVPLEQHYCYSYRVTVLLEDGRGIVASAHKDAYAKCAVGDRVEVNLKKESVFFRDPAPDALRTILSRNGKEYYAVFNDGSMTEIKHLNQETLFECGMPRVDFERAVHVQKENFIINIILIAFIPAIVVIVLIIKVVGSISDYIIYKKKRPDNDYDYWYRYERPY